MSTRPTIRRSPLSGAFALLLVVGLVPVAWFLLILLLLGGFIDAQLPDPSIPNGDPCCGYPDTWGEVIGSLFFSAALGALLLLVLVAMGALVRWTATGRWLTRRRWLQIAGGGATLSAAGFCTMLALAATARQPTDCDAFTISRERFRSPDAEIRREEARAIEDCQLPGARVRPTDVRRLLGEPDRILQPRDDQTAWRYRDLEVTFADGEAVYSAVYPHEGREE